MPACTGGPVMLKSPFEEKLQAEDRTQESHIGGVGETSSLLGVDIFGLSSCSLKFSVSC